MSNNKVSTAQLAKMSRQWQWLQNARKNSTVSGAVYVRPQCVLGVYSVSVYTHGYTVVYTTQE